MRLISFIYLLFLVSDHAAAETFRSDAFGLTRGEARDRRDKWSGLAVRTSDRQSQTEVVKPGDPRYIVFLLGPKSIVAGKEPGHAVALAVDEYGNPVGAGHSADMTLEGAEGASVPLQIGLASYLFEPTTSAGFFAAGAAVGDIQSNRASFRVVPDLQSAIADRPNADIALAPEKLQTIDLPVLIDRFGNALPDGTMLSVTGQVSDGSALQFSALSIDGMPRVSVIPRDTRGAVTLSTSLGAHAGPSAVAVIEGYEIVSAPRLMAIPHSDISASTLIAGPLRSSSGYNLSDGVEVVFDLGQGRRHSTWVLDGHAEVMVPFPSSKLSGPVTLHTPFGAVITGQVQLQGDANTVGAE